ncbi:hypothetical protein LTS08_006114 [Lithohypha guttulata]|uniref:Isochorismatase-like domain-containing protein n=1 Tax=Lithohypha guttulata TaxID=1690604 RepID=A0AAN7SW25_9EURO|nr:hypothetical protein LTR05_006949 [Lithohypha guttulata]KAK5098736.1 hypothetical protein LTS08_006114 [Lithohypha guttulata]
MGSADVKGFRQLLGIPPSTPNINSSTLVIIDAQNEYADGILKTVNVTQSRRAISSVLEKYRQSTHSGKNIIHVQHQTPQGAPVFTSETPLFDEFEELTPKQGEKVIAKNFPSSFGKTDLDEYLKGLGDLGKQIVLVGYMAHVCVSTTARTGAELGYDVVVVSDAIGDRDIPGIGGLEVTKVVLQELGDAFATIVSSEEIQV